MHTYINVYNTQTDAHAANKTYLCVGPVALHACCAHHVYVSNLSCVPTHGPGRKTRIFMRVYAARK